MFRHRFVVCFVLLLLISLGLACNRTESSQEPQEQPPDVQIKAPLSGLQVNKGDQVAVEAIVEDADGVSRVELWVDGELLDAQDAQDVPPTSFPVIFYWTAVTPGPHTLKVQAYDAGSVLGGPVAVTVEVVDGDGVGTAPAMQPATPQWTSTTPSLDTATPGPTLGVNITATGTITATSTLSVTATPTATVTATATVTPQPSFGDVIFIPAGYFLMGSTLEQVDRFVSECPSCGRAYFEDELYQRQIYLSGYYIDKYEVSVAQFATFARSAGYQSEAERKGEPAANTWRVDDVSGRRDHPARWITWNDADVYCEWAGKRLPTEAEWERAARGTQGLLWPWGDGWDASRTPGGDTAPVDSYRNGASPNGLHMAAGNVWEWVADWYDPVYWQSDPGPNPQGPGSGVDRVLKGGGFGNATWDMRPAHRHRGGQSGYAPDHGFRCARTP